MVCINGFPALPIPQEHLDLSLRPSRSSALPWRGQFSPQLVANLLSTYASQNMTVCDPFVGSGTVLLEAARRKLPSLGVEVNPAALEFATIACFAGLPLAERQSCVAESERRAHALLEELPRAENLQGDLPTVSRLLRGTVDGAATRWSRGLLAAGLLLAMKNGKNFRPAMFGNAVQNVLSIVRGMADEVVETSACLADARDLPLEDGRVGLVLTSPPYINVFNYHHHYRPAVEILGWEVLTGARSEIGSNRKHRQNRFLTVVQYALDMAEFLSEATRVLGPEGRIVMILGRESNVLGTPFYNGQIVSEVALYSLGLELEAVGERRFQNKYGQVIYEDILVICGTPKNDLVENVARTIGIRALADAVDRCPSGSITALKNAIRAGGGVNPSVRLAEVLTYPSGHSVGPLRPQWRLS